MCKITVKILHKSAFIIFCNLILVVFSCGKSNNSTTSSRTKNGNDAAQISADSGNVNDKKANKSPNSCKKNSVGNESQNPNQALPKLSFENDIKPIFNKYCISCHTTTPPNLTMEASAQAAAANALQQILSGKMPPVQKLSDQEIALLKAWSVVQSTSLNLASAAPTPATPTWYDNILPFSTGKCAYCHSGTSIKKIKPYLDSYTAVKSNANNILSTMMDGSMPPSTATPKLVPSDITSFKDWIAANYPMGTAPPVFDTTKPIYYTQGIDSLLSTYCVTCHKGGGQSPDLSTYDAAKTAGPLSLADIQSGKMPPSGALNANSVDGFKAWANGGYLLNATSTPTTTPAPTTIDPSKGAYYNNNINIILTNRCVSCHTTGAQAPNLSSYDLAKNAGALSLADINSGKMPPNAALPAAESALFKAWADAAFPLDSTSTPTPPASTSPGSSNNAVFYYDDIATLIKSNCLLCHATGGSLPDLSTYETAKLSGSLSLMAMQAGTMPKAAPLSAQDIALFKLWADAGFPAGTKSNSASTGSPTGTSTGTAPDTSNTIGTNTSTTQSGPADCN